MNRNQLRRLARERIGDAEVLVKNRRFAAAYYLAGYAVECSLKARIAKRTKRHDLPPKPNEVREIYTHDLEKLRSLARLEAVFNQLAETDPTFQRYWAVVKDWSEESRYEARGERKAKDILKAVSDPEHGVFQCIRRHW